MHKKYTGKLVNMMAKPMAAKVNTLRIIAFRKEDFHLPVSIGAAMMGRTTK